MSDELTPITRKETFLAKAGGQNVVTPTPITREEIFLQAIIDNGGGGGGTGGGVLVVNDNNGTLTKTWAEITTAAESSIVVLIQDGGSESGTTYSYLESSFANIEEDYFEVVFRKEGTTIGYFCASSTDYPVLDA